MITTTAHNDYLKITRINLTDFCKGTEGLIHWQQHHGRKGGWQLPLNFWPVRNFFLARKVSQKKHLSEGNFHPQIEKTWLD